MDLLEPNFWCYWLGIKLQDEQAPPPPESEEQTEETEEKDADLEI
jgi:hypothetical protein